MSEAGKDIGAVLNGRLRIEYGNNRIIVNDGATDILLLGQGMDGQITVELAQQGFDVKTTTPEHLIFSSRFNLFKIVHTDTFTLLAANFGNSGNAYLTKLATQIVDLDPFNVAQPIVLVFVEDPLGAIIPLPYYSFNYDTGALTWQAVGRVASTNDLYVEVRSTVALSPAVTFRYYVLQETSG